MIYVKLVAMNMNEGNKQHTKLCSQCMELKETGLTMSLYFKWRDQISRKSAIENAVKTLNANADIGLLNDGVCNDCSWLEYQSGKGIEVFDISDSSENVVNDRLMGRLKGLSGNSLFIWSDDDLSHAKKALECIGRSDIEVVGPSWLNLVGRQYKKYNQIAIDSKAWLIFTPQQIRNARNAVRYFD